MRIAFFIDVFPRLSNNFILEQIVGLLDRGHEVDIFARAEGDFDFTHRKVQEYGLRSRMRFVPMPRSYPRRIAVAAKKLSRQYARSGCVLDALNPLRHGREAVSLLQLYTVLSFLEHRGYDIIHAQFGQLGPPLVPLIRTRELESRLVVSFRGADTSSWLKARPDIYRELFQVVDLCLPVCDYFRRRLQSLGCPPERLHVLRSGIDLGAFPFRERRLPVDGSVRILFVGRLAAKKGLLEALEAFARVAAKVQTPLELRVVGDGELRSEAQKRASELDIAHLTTWTGPLRGQHLLDEIIAGHILLAPSRTAANGDQEGIPNVLKEAMATGMPVLSTRHSGIPELVEEGVTGLLADEGDVSALGCGLYELISNPHRWAQMGRDGRKAVERGFDIERLNDELEMLYRNVLRR